MNNKSRYNKQIREYIVETIDKYLLDCGSFEDAYSSFTEYFYQIYSLTTSKEGLLLSNGDDPNLDFISATVFYSFLCQILYLDAYKYYAYKHKNLSEKLDDLSCLVELDAIDDYYDLFSTVSTNPMLFSDMINAAYEFHEINVLSKILMVRSLTDEENEKLNRVAPMHQEDLVFYGKSNPIKLSSLVNSYKSNKKMYQEILGYEDELLLNDSYASFIINLAKYDRDNAIKLCLEIAINDYEASKYLADIVIDTNIIINHIDFYEKCSRAQIIGRMLTDRSFLTDAITMAMDKIISNEYAGNIIYNIDDDDTIEGVRSKLR